MRSYKTETFYENQGYKHPKATFLVNNKFIYEKTFLTNKQTNSVKKTNKQKL